MPKNKQTVMPHLVAPDPPQRARLGDMLARADDATAMLAVDMMKADGAPVGTFEPLLLIMQNPRRGAKLRAGAKRVWTDHVPEPAQKAAEKVLLRVSLFGCEETKLSERLAALGKESSGELDPMRLGELLLAYRRGAQYVLEHGTESQILFALTAYREGDALDLSGAELAALPDATAKLNNVRSLALGMNGLSRNNFRRVPGVLTKMQSLHDLDISENRLTSLDDTLGRMRKLTTLNLAGNFFCKFPKELCALTALTSLDISTISNGAEREIPFTELPEAIGAMQSLEVLRLDAHRPQTLPQALRSLPNLRKLSLVSVQLGEVPAWLAELPALRELEVTDLKTKDKKALAAVVAKLRARGVKVTE